MHDAVILRPQPGASATLARIEAAGFRGLCAPLFAIDPVAWTPPDPASFDGLLIGSANVFRHASEDLALYRNLPVYAVGAATADAARDAGFTVAQTGKGGLQSLIEPAFARGKRRLLRLAGEEHVALDLPDALTVATIITYRARALPLSAAARTALYTGAIALLHSAAAARELAIQLGAERAAIGIICIGPRVAAAAGPGWQLVTTAPSPDDAAMLEVLRRLCHEGGRGEMYTSGSA